MLGTSTYPATDASSGGARRSRIESALLAASTVATGLMAGFFFAYACSVMVGLARTEDRTFIEAMQWINATVRNAAFGPVFFGALALTVAAAALVLARRRPARLWVVAAAVLYAGAFLVTMGFSVPLNEQLASAGPVEAIADPSAVRAAYEGPWVAWNLVRTALSIAAVAALVAALVRRRR
ncbi:anthrone oxygenase family protein [Modestobacter sp. SYSU DS0657]